MELKDDSKEIFEEAVGLSIYSTSKPTILSHISIFQSLWSQAELSDNLKIANEKLKVHDKMQKEFINVAAHELRIPVQSIIGYTQLAMNDSEFVQFDKEHDGFLDVIYRNADRLHKLTEEILDVARIESNTLRLNKEQFDLIELILEIIQDFHRKTNNLDIYSSLIEQTKERENAKSLIK